MGSHYPIIKDKRKPYLLNNFSHTLVAGGWAFSKVTMKDAVWLSDIITAVMVMIIF